ncbi:MAG TPA: hypothetical protein VJR06_00610 [Nitrososphaerales archaeon]|nr:hypothetical protein [Nitrososphaerales archaeon]
MNTLAYERTSPRHPKAVASALAVLLLALSIPVVALVAPSGAAASLNDVQVSIQTTQSLPYQYTLTAYNASGNQVASFYGNYPQASFGLPSGTYLITASANYQSYGCYLCPLAGGATTPAPIKYLPPSSEYGYAIVKVTGPVQIPITTKNNTDLPLVSLAVHVSFHNGTAASGTSVYAYAVGMGYSYSPNMVSYGQTGSDGNFTLVMPDAPIEVSAYLSVPVQLPKNVTTVVPVEVGGQVVNVTVYWQPSYVGLYGQALILPPETGANIVLQVQPNPYPIYYSVPGQSGPSVVTTVTSTATGSSGQPTGQSTSAGQPGKISPFSPSGAQLSPGQSVSTQPSSPYTTVALVLVAGLAIVVVVGVVLGRRNRTAPGARP